MAGRTKAQHHKSTFALRAAAMIQGGGDPGLLDEVEWWRTDDLWVWSLEALAVSVRAAADINGQSAASVGPPSAPARRNTASSPGCSTARHDCTNGSVPSPEQLMICAQLDGATDGGRRVVCVKMDCRILGRRSAQGSRRRDLGPATSPFCAHTFLG